MKKWYNWPANYYEKSWKPWYGILRTLLFAPVVILGFSILYIGMFLVEGFEEAESLRKDIF